MKKEITIMSEKIDMVAIMNGKKIFSNYSGELVVFVKRIAKKHEKDPKGVYSDGVTLIDNIGDAEADISHMHCLLKNGGAYNIEDFYAEYGAFDEGDVFSQNVMELIADR
jgi:hypothetical protein